MSEEKKGSSVPIIIVIVGVLFIVPLVTMYFAVAHTAEFKEFLRDVGIIPEVHRLPPEPSPSP